MGAFTFLITIILLAIGFSFMSIWGKKESIAKEKIQFQATKNIDVFFKNVKNVYDEYYPTIHMINYFHHECIINNTNNDVIADDTKYTPFYKGSFNCADTNSSNQFRYKDIILLSNGEMCKVELNQTTNNYNIKWNTCQKLEKWYDNNIITKIDYGLLQKFIPPDTGNYDKLAGLIFEGTEHYQASVYSVVPFLRMRGVLLKKVAKEQFDVVKYYPIRTLDVIKSKIKYADALIDTYSYYIRTYAKKLYQNSTYNPYVFKYTLSSLITSNSSDFSKKRAIALPGISYYGIDTSLLVALPNTYTYKKINGYDITNFSGNPLDPDPGNYYEGLFESSINSPYRDDDIINLQSDKKLYALRNENDSNKLISYDINEWDDSTTEDTLFAFLRIGSDCKASDYTTSYCKKYLWYHEDNNSSILSITPSIFKTLYLDLYKRAYNNSNFRGINQYGAISMEVVTTDTGDKEAKLYLKTINDYYKDMFTINLERIFNSKVNPFFGRFIKFPGTNYASEQISATLLIDNTSNVNYPIDMLDDNTISIYTGYTISFAIPCVYDVADTKNKISILPGLYIKSYSITTVE